MLSFINISLIFIYITQLFNDEKQKHKDIYYLFKIKFIIIIIKRQIWI